MVYAHYGIKHFATVCLYDGITYVTHIFILIAFKENHDFMHVSGVPLSSRIPIGGHYISGSNCLRNSTHLGVLIWRSIRYIIIRNVGAFILEISLSFHRRILRRLLFMILPDADNGLDRSLWAPPNINFKRLSDWDKKNGPRKPEKWFLLTESTEVILAITGKVNILQIATH